MKDKIKELLPVLKYFKKYKTRLLLFSGILFITNISLFTIPSKNVILIIIGDVYYELY